MLNVPKPARVMRAIALLFVFGMASPAFAQTQTQYGLSGVTVYDRDHLFAFAHQHLALTEGVVTAERLARAMQQVYREDGYLLAEVTVHSRADGGHDFIVYEGAIGAIEVAGVDQPMFRRIRSQMLPMTAQRPLTQRAFERAVMLTGDLAGLDIATELSFPDPDSDALLSVHGEVERQGGRVTVDTPPRELGRAFSIYGSQEFYSVATAGDLLRLSFGATSHYGNGQGTGLSGSLFYRAPVGANGAYVEGYAGNVVARRDASGGFARTDFTGYQVSAAMGVNLHRDVESYSYLVGEVRTSEAESTVGAGAFASAINAASLIYTAGRTTPLGRSHQLFASLTAGERNGTLPAGVDDGDNGFWYLRLGYSAAIPVHILHENVALRFDIVGQATSARLPSVEQLYLGERHMLRGYTQAEASGDKGIIASLEVDRYFEGTGGRVTGWSAFGFLDLGRVANNAPGATRTASVTLASAGVGASVSFDNRLSMNGWIGVPLRAGPRTAKGSPAVYLGMSMSW